MNASSLTLQSADAYTRAGASALLLLGLTALHHAYGAFAYEAPWRLHVVFVAVPVAIGIVAMLWFARLRRGSPVGRLAAGLAAATILLVPVATIGVFEGGYNHVLKNIVYFGVGKAEALAMFPPPAYEIPNDWFFELTGVAQLPLAILTAVQTLRLLRQARQ